MQKTFSYKHKMGEIMNSSNKSQKNSIINTLDRVILFIIQLYHQLTNQIIYAK